MQSLQFKQAEQNFDQLCKKACEDHEPWIVNRDDNNHVVILSLADFNAWQSTIKPENKIYAHHTIRSTH